MREQPQLELPVVGHHERIALLSPKGLADAVLVLLERCAGGEARGVTRGGPARPARVLTRSARAKAGAGDGACEEPRGACEEPGGGARRVHGENAAARGGAGSSAHRAGFGGWASATRAGPSRC